MENNQPTNSKKTLVSIGAFLLVAIGVAAFAFVNKKPAPIAADDSSTSAIPAVPTEPIVSGNSPTDAASGNATSTPAGSATPVASTEYKDGTYNATGKYQSPGGPDQIGVTLTIANDIVTDASVVPMPGDPMSANYQGKFASGYKAQVVGKPVDSIDLKEVSGSSLTPIGFDNALAAIKAQAKS